MQPLTTLSPEQVSHVATQLRYELLSYYARSGLSINTQRLVHIREAAHKMVNSFFWPMTQAQKDAAVNIALSYIEVEHPEACGV